MKYNPVHITLALSCSFLIGFSNTAKCAETSVPVLSESKAPASWKYANEDTWIVSKIGRDIAEILTYARARANGTDHLDSSFTFTCTELDRTAGKYKFVLTPDQSTQPITYEFQVKEYIWGPENYTPFAKQLLDTYGLKAADSSEIPKDFIAKVADATSKSLFEENDRVSAGLSKAPLDASFHDQAALIQTLFNMKELAKYLSDTRPPLARMCTHLAISKALKPDAEKSIVAQISEIGLVSMSCRDGVAVQMINAIEDKQSDNTVKSFLRAIKVRATGDYRYFVRKNCTAIEELQFGLRFAEHFKSDALIPYLSKNQPEPAISWQRIGSSNRISVSAGHHFDTNLLDREMEDFLEDFKLFKKSPFVNLKQLNSELNKVPGRCYCASGEDHKLMALSWDDLAAFHERHICAGFVGQYGFLEYAYGEHTLAKACLQRSRNTFASSILFPFALLQAELDPRDTKTNLDNCISVIETSPEILTAYSWNMAQGFAETEKEKSPDWKGKIIPPSTFFDPPFPIGTAFYFDSRYSMNPKKFNLDSLTQLRTIHPYDRILCKRWAELKYGTQPTAAQLELAYGKIAEHDTHVMVAIANADAKDPAKFEQRMNKVAQFEPIIYITLGNYFAEQNLPEKASKYFNLAFISKGDDVAKANHSWWFVNYLFNKGEIAKAMLIANFSAEVYSNSGLATQARLLERMNRLSEAEIIYMKIADRYGTDENDYKGALNGFYIRHAAKKPTQAEQVIHKYFPKGLIKVSLKGLKNTPFPGPKVTDVPWSIKDLPIKAGMTVIALDGYRVENAKQFKLIDYSNFNPNKKVIFWDGKQYREAILAAQEGMTDLGVTDEKPKQK